MTAITLEDIYQAADYLNNFLLTTPVIPVTHPSLQQRVGKETRVHLKLELLQHTGSFKARGVLMNLARLSATELAQGVTTASGGNHGVAVAYGAQSVDTSAKIVLPKTASPLRIKTCQEYGAELVLADDIQSVFPMAQAIAETEKRTFIHPFDGRQVALGSASLGLEFYQQVSDLDAVIVAIGGGGLCSGVATAFKLLAPHINVYGVEPEGANSMQQSFACGEPVSLSTLNTIADSLAAPHAEAYSFDLCQRYVDELVTITDDMMREAMRDLFEYTKLAVEPAGAAALAALLGPLAKPLRGKSVGVIVCGSNIDVTTFVKHVSG